MLEMDNRLHQQLSTGWTFRWQQIFEYGTDRRVMLKLSVLLLILLFLKKIMLWGLLCWMAHSLRIAGLLYSTFLTQNA